MGFNRVQLLHYGEKIEVIVQILISQHFHLFHLTFHCYAIHVYDAIVESEEAETFDACDGFNEGDKVCRILQTQITQVFDVADGRGAYYHAYRYE